jgi:transglutaminase-like putative cysteine protease
MNAPPLLLTASLLFWGWQTGLLALAAIMALVLEGSRLGNLRWELSSSDFRRITDLCVLVFLGMFAYLYSSKKGAIVFVLVLQWLPLALLPLLVCQAYSVTNKITLKTLFLIFRRKGTEEDDKPQKPIDLTYLYIALCIISASAANVRTLWFYLGLFFLSGWALWRVKSTRYSLVLWLCVLVFAGLLGYVGQAALDGLHSYVEGKAVEWYSNLFGAERSPYKTATAIGDIRSLKPSSRILFRVKPGSKTEPPVLLREATYNLYKSGRWFASRSDFKPLRPDTDGMSWGLQPDLGTDEFMVISTYLRRGKGILKLPKGASRIDELPVARAELNQYGAVKVDEGPGLINYRVRYREGTSLNDPPSQTDLTIPPNEAAAITECVRKLELASKSPRDVLSTLAGYFSRNFEYSLELQNKGGNTSPIADFLFRSRSGHCEYFATTTVLLLRGAGVPARYATGYSVNEKSTLENTFIVRDRHAHSWVLAYLDGAWQDFDTTPVSWRGIEAEAVSRWEPIADIWSWCVFKFSQWRWSEGGGIGKYLWWFLLPLALLLFWRLYSRKKVTRLRPEQEPIREEEKPGATSEFYLIEKKMGDLGFLRYPWETLSMWIERVEESEHVSISTESLRFILNLHYRYRFDPEGISQAERSALKSGVQSWLEQHPDTGGLK